MILKVRLLGKDLGRRLPDQRRGRIAPVLALLLIVVSPPARADDLSVLFDPGTIVSVGGFVGAGPRFQGSRQVGLWGLPYLSCRKADEPREWWSPDDALDATLFGQGRFQAGVVLDVRDGRHLSDDRRLAGLPRLPVTAGLGVFGEVWPIADTLRLRAEVTQGIRAHDGLIAKLGADLVGRFGRFTLSAGPRFVLGDDAALRLDFDVPVGTAIVNPALGPYRARGGARSSGATAAVSYDLTEAWQIFSYVRYDRLIASAADSPITRRIGTPNQLTVATGALYSFPLSP